nr:hypothetical protein GCM10017745_67670 [Saccharothrix mutabilis subsp. capreolus]
MSEVDCLNFEAHYRSIENFPGTDMSRCDTVPQSQYSYSVTVIRGRTRLDQTVHCLIGLGPTPGNRRPSGSTTDAFGR